jgi:hypothetical protein
VSGTEVRILLAQRGHSGGGSLQISTEPPVFALQLTDPHGLALVRRHQRPEHGGDRRLDERQHRLGLWLLGTCHGRYLLAAGR